MLDDIMKELEKIGADIDVLVQKAEKAVEPEKEKLKEKYKGSEAESIVNEMKADLKKLADELSKKLG